MENFKDKVAARLAAAIKAATLRVLQQQGAEYKEMDFTTERTLYTEEVTFSLILKGLKEKEN